MRKLTIALAVIFVVVFAGLAGCQPVASPLEDMEWVLKWYEKDWQRVTVLGDTEITAFFNGEEKQVSGSAGCNSYGGGYEVNKLSLSMAGPFFVTEMWCGDEKGEQERKYLEALQAAESFQLDHGDLIIEGGGWRLLFEQR